LPALSLPEAMGSPACRRRFLGLRVGNVAPLHLRGRTPTALRRFEQSAPIAEGTVTRELP